MKKPVLFLIFNRPETTQLVFNEISKYKPNRLYIASDGARADKPGEKLLVKQSREIINQIDWPCEVKTLFRNENLGCRVAVSEAITWFFENEEEGIILEDDCLPHKDFFTFCEVMLDRYADDNRIMHIGGTNFQFGKHISNGDYYFSTIAHIWGWATWRRSWKLYDGTFANLNTFYKERRLKKLYPNHFYLRWYWRKSFDTVKKRMTTWDYQWSFTLLYHGGLAIIPEKNLIINIGFTDGATHGSFIPENIKKMKFENLNTFNEPSERVANISADAYTVTHIFEFNIFDRIVNKVKKFLRNGR